MTTPPVPPRYSTSPGQPGPQRYPGPIGTPASGSAPRNASDNAHTHPAAGRTNTLAVIALIAAFLAPIVGLVLGLVARRQIRRTRENGRGLATSAVVLGSLFSLAWIAVIVVVASVGTVSGSFSTTPAVPASSVASQIETRSGLPAGSVSCPDSLPATVGATTTCTATVGGRPTPVEATVTTVDGTDVGFDFTSR